MYDNIQGQIKTYKSRLCNMRGDIDAATEKRNCNDAAAAKPNVVYLPFLGRFLSGRVESC